MSNYPVQDFIYKHAPWTMIFYMRKQYGFGLPWLTGQWIKSKPGEYRVFGGQKTKVNDFVDRVIDRDVRENRVQYACVNGCCTIIWHIKKNIDVGGAGPAGCSCENLDDPRDLVRGPLSAKA